MECKQHKIEMFKEKSFGWCGTEVWVCPECAAEKIRLAVLGKNEVKSEAKEKTRWRGGWQ